MTRPHIVLVGLMGTGKSTIGRRLASRLQCDFVDSDAVVEQRTGRTVREIFESDGEDSFRAVEESVITEALSSTRPSVVAAAGGSVLSARSRTAMKESQMVVWLDGPVALLARRAGGRKGTGHRPLIDADPELRLNQMRLAREHLYSDVATTRVDVANASPSDIVDRLIALLEATETAERSA